MRKTLFLTEEGFFHLKNPPQKHRLPSIKFQEGIKWGI